MTQADLLIINKAGDSVASPVARERLDRLSRRALKLNRLFGKHLTDSPRVARPYRAVELAEAVGASLEVMVRRGGGLDEAAWDLDCGKNDFHLDESPRDARRTRVALVPLDRSRTCALSHTRR